MRCMRNRSGVVLPFRQELVDQAKLDFTECDINGEDVEREVVSLEEKLTEKQPPRKSKSKKKVSLTESLDIEE